MAIGVLVLGKPGTGKSFSMKHFTPEEVKILSVAKPILPFRGKYEVVKTPSGDDIIREMKNTKKKNIVIDDFQYILGLPMMHRVSEKGWDKFNEIQQPYADVLEAINDLPDDVIVYFTSHTDTDNDGNTKIKTIGNALDKYIAVEGLFMIVLGTVVVNDHYYFATQNSGNDTLKSPEGMFPSKWIPNNLKYVEEKIRNYYYMDGAKTDEEMAEIDRNNTVNDEEVKPKKRTRKTKTHDEVVEENTKKIEEYQDKVDEKVAEVAGDEKGADFDEVMDAVDDDVKKPELETPPRRTRKERKASETEEEPMNEPEEPTTEESTEEEKPTRRRRRTRE